MQPFYVKFYFIISHLQSSEYRITRLDTEKL